MDNSNLINRINAVEGFDPTPYAVDYTDLNTGETRKRLPVMAQMAWFRLKYPEGRIAVQVAPGKDCFLAEATASKSYLEDKPPVSPREWAQTAAVGIALRNAGFGLQFAMAGDEFPEVAVEGAPINAVPGMAQEDKLAQAMKVPCPISKFKGKTLGEVLQLDPGAVKWLAEKFTGSEEIRAAAQFIRDCALSQAIA